MSLLLLAPLGLLALAALIVPALIHLRRRTEEVPVDFAAMRWLEAMPRPRSKLRFDELLLLALRLALVALLALLLARPAVLGWHDDEGAILVAPGVDAVGAREFAGPETEPQWIAPGFPDLDDDPPDSAPVSSLIRQFDAELPQETTLTILVPTVLEGVDAEQLRLTRPVEWRIVGTGEPNDTPVPVPSPALSLRYPQGVLAAPRYFEAAAQAWSEEADVEAATSSELPSRDRVLIWLNPGPVPVELVEWVRGGGTALLGQSAEIAMPGTTAELWRDEMGNTLVEGGPLGTGRLMRFTRSLDPAAMPELLDGSFPAQLRELVTPEAPPPARVAAADFEPTAGAAPYALPPKELTSWLAVIAALLFLAERLLAARLGRFAG